MPNIKSSSKRDQLSKKQNISNRAAKSLLKNNIKKFDVAVKAGDHEAAVSAYKVAVKNVDHAAAKHLVHKNCAANKKSQLTKQLNSLAQ